MFQKKPCRYTNAHHCVTVTCNVQCSPGLHRCVAPRATAWAPEPLCAVGWGVLSFSFQIFHPLSTQQPWHEATAGGWENNALHKPVVWTSRLALGASRVHRGRLSGHLSNYHRERIGYRTKSNLRKAGNKIISENPSHGEKKRWMEFDQNCSPVSIQHCPDEVRAIDVLLCFQSRAKGGPLLGELVFWYLYAFFNT